MFQPFPLNMHSRTGECSASIGKFVDLLFQSCLVCRHHRQPCRHATELGREHRDLVRRFQSGDVACLAKLLLQHTDPPPLGLHGRRIAGFKLRILFLQRPVPCFVSGAPRPQRYHTDTAVHAHKAVSHPRSVSHPRQCQVAPRAKHTRATTTLYERSHCTPLDAHAVASSAHHASAGTSKTMASGPTGLARPPRRRVRCVATWQRPHPGVGSAARLPRPPALSSPQ